MAGWRYTDDFKCVICLRMITMRWNFTGPDMLIPPICTSCERWYSEGYGKPSGGSFRDRREVRRGIAMAEALHTEAARISRRSQHASA